MVGIKLVSAVVDRFQMWKQYRFRESPNRAFSGSYTDEYCKRNNASYEPDAEKVKATKAAILTCQGITEERTHEVFSVKFTEIYGSFWWDVRDFEEVTLDVNMDKNSTEDKMELKIEDCQKESLTEARKQVNEERETQEIEFARRWLRGQEDRLDTLNREITAREKEKKDIQEKIKAHFGAAK